MGGRVLESSCVTVNTIMVLSEVHGSSTRGTARVCAAALALVAMSAAPLAYADPVEEGGTPAPVTCVEPATKTMVVTVTYTPTVPVLTDIPGIYTTVLPPRPTM